MQLKLSAFLLATASFACISIVQSPSAPAQTTPATPATHAPVPGHAWIDRSDKYTQLLIDVDFSHSPESASGEGLAQYDSAISKLTREDEDVQRKETEAVLAKLKSALATEKDPRVAQDLQILIHSTELGFRSQDYSRQLVVPFLNVPEIVFSGLQSLLDDQTVPERRKAAVIRLKKYTGLEPGYTPITDLAKRYVELQVAVPSAVYPSRIRMETELGRNSNYVDGIAALFRKYNLTGWEPAYAKLKTQLADYDAWQRSTILPHARTDFRLPPEQYALDLENYGVDIPPDQLTAMAHQAFTEIQGEMAPIAAQIAQQRHLPSSDYRDVIRELKKAQITGDAIVPFYTNRLHEIERIIVAHNIITLPNRPAIIRLATAAETVQVPAPHMQPPPLLHNTGERGVFILPLNLPAAAGAKASAYDDFTFDAAAWTLTAHEARPGHELQFDSMVEQGVSKARALYAFNSTNAEGWGLYSEYLIEPYMPLEGQLVSLDYRLHRAARAFLDPELQAGKVTPAEAKALLMHDVGQSDAFAQSEVERYTFKSPGQANSYFYGYTKLISLRKETEAALGSRFNQQRFHDFILSQGLLPPDLMRKAVLEDFIPKEKAAH
jgi:Bacterial protein of unknown function (DUF885)